ncbi:MAG: ribonuclease HII, partial [Thermoanaerobaculia bacterium]
MGSGSGVKRRRAQPIEDRAGITGAELEFEPLPEAPSLAARNRRFCPLADEGRRLDGLLRKEADAHVAGYRFVAGMDEVGRGCLAGPVYAGAVVLREGHRVPGIDDSKVLLAEVRSELSLRIKRRALGVGVGAATPAEIDVLGIVEATYLAMRRALGALKQAGIEIDLVLFDAVRLPGLLVEQRAYIRGDATVACIAAASIVAKTARDLFMEGLHAEFPVYGFASHRGYGTREHFEALRRVGPSPAHRLSFE